jgi:hypothetical protein
LCQILQRKFKNKNDKVTNMNQQQGKEVSSKTQGAGRERYYREPVSV